MPSFKHISLSLNTAGLRERVELATFKAVETVFIQDIHPAAAKGSPVDTGWNRNNIKTSTVTEGSAVRAKLYTTSGYGAYLELGTRRMKARPYLWPAFAEFIGVIPREVKRLLRG
jgi:HK97 gp10 family phage protein